MDQLSVKYFKSPF